VYDSLAERETVDNEAVRLQVKMTEMTTPPFEITKGHSHAGATTEFVVEVAGRVAGRAVVFGTMDVGEDRSTAERRIAMTEVGQRTVVSAAKDWVGRMESAEEKRVAEETGSKAECGSDVGRKAKAAEATKYRKQTPVEVEAEKMMGDALPSSEYEFEAAAETEMTKANRSHPRFHLQAP